MEFLLNGRAMAIDNSLTIAGLVAERGLNPETIVVECNLAIVAREAWASVILKPGDKVEIIAFVGGG
ncbi:MAG: sulfur carrier protein ThiS [Negativicutes bacterium]|nr:sulfur carrier protein ThiS [Negativicutes bacterium]